MTKKLQIGIVASGVSLAALPAFAVGTVPAEAQTLLDNLGATQTAIATLVATAIAFWVAVTLAKRFKGV